MLKRITTYFGNISAEKSKQYVLIFTVLCAVCGLSIGFFAGTTKDTGMVLEVITVFAFVFAMFFFFAFFVLVTTKCPGACITAAGISSVAFSSAVVGVLLEKALLNTGSVFISSIMLLAALLAGVVYLIIFTMKSWSKHLAKNRKE